MTENEELRRKLDMIDGQLCALLAKREELAGSDPGPDRRRLAAVRRIGQRFGANVAEAYRSILTGGYKAPTGAFGNNAGTAPKIMDITRELLGARVFPGDAAPAVEPLRSIADGDECNLSKLTVGSHSGTHMDAPLHFIDGGADISEVPPEKYIGKSLVADWERFVSGNIPEGCERLLLKNARELTEEQARYAAGLGLRLLGTEELTVGGAGIHRLLLGSGTVLLESTDLSAVREGVYFLFCAPLKISGADGAPCRAFLIPV